MALRTLDPRVEFKPMDGVAMPDGTPILPRLREGQAGAAHDLVAEYEGEVYRVALRTTGDEHLAADATQVTFLNLLRHSAGTASLPATPEDELRFVRGVARYEGIRVSKTAGRQIEARPDRAALVGPSSLPGPHQVAVVTERASLVAAAIARLKPNLRSAIELFYYEGCTYQEIADRIDKPIGTVRSRLSEAIVQLRKILKRELDP